MSLEGIYYAYEDQGSAAAARHGSHTLSTTDQTLSPAPGLAAYGPFSAAHSYRSQERPPRQTVLEVLWHEKAPCTYYVLAGWGEQSDWVKNIEKTLQVTVAVGRRCFRAGAMRLSPEEAEVKVLAYARQHPRLIRYLPRLLGYRMP